MVVTPLVNPAQPNLRSFVTTAIRHIIRERHVGSYMVLHLVVVGVVMDNLEDAEVVVGDEEVALGDVAVFLCPSYIGG